MYELMHLTLIIFTLVELASKGGGQDFGYEGNEGPDFWGHNFSHCVGKHQSPINIDEHNVEEVEMLPLIYENFKNEAELAVTNNGHTVQFKLSTNTVPTITGGPLLGKYQFTQFHFHWGATDEEGSESQINNHSFPMELHMVFYSTSYGTFEEATEHPDGLCVVSFVYSKAEEDNENYRQIINLLPQVNEVGSSAKGTDPIVLELLLTEDKEHYYTYGGSLTTPPCSEVVTWIEFKSTIPLSHEQIEKFRQLHSAHGEMRHNFRPTQNLNGRVIRTNKNIFCRSSSDKTSSLFTLVGMIGASAVLVNLN